MDVSTFSKPTGYVDTGCYALNSIISGDIHRGIPEGRITTFFGESGCVPANTNIQVLARVNSTNMKYLTSILDVIEIPHEPATLLKALFSIGFNISELSKELSLSRLSVRRILTGGTTRLKSNTKTAIFTMCKKSTYNVKIVDIQNLKPETFLVNTPDGFQKCNGFYPKGLKPCLTVSYVDNNGKKASFPSSEDHMFQSPVNGVDEWKFTINLKPGDLIKSNKNCACVESVTPCGDIECFDIGIDHENHRYYTNGLVSHNSGKSLIVAQTIINAIQKNNYDCVFYFDTEGGGLHDYIKNSGVDMSKIEHSLISSTEDASIKILKVLKEIKEYRNECIKEGTKEPKIMCVLDSFGMLVSNKTIDDAVDKDKQVADMGSESKAKNKFIKSINILVIEANTPFIIVNHTYDNPGAMYTSKIKEQPGGKSLLFASHVMVQSSKSLQRDKEKNGGLDSGNSYFNGNTIRYFTVKNRLVKYGFEAEMFVSVNTGIGKWEGLVADARRLGFITGGAVGRYKVPSYSDKNVTLSDIMTNDAIWETFVEELNAKKFKELEYTTGVLKCSDEDVTEAELLKDGE